MDHKQRAKNYREKFSTKQDAINRIDISLQSFKGKNIEHNENLRFSYNTLKTTREELLKLNY